MPYCKARIDTVVFDFINLIKSKYLYRGPDFLLFGFSLVAQFFTLDVITNLIYGELFRYLTKNKDAMLSL
jgi:hypothetical protein